MPRYTLLYLGKDLHIHELSVHTTLVDAALAQREAERGLEICTSIRDDYDMTSIPQPALDDVLWDASMEETQ